MSILPASPFDVCDLNLIWLRIGETIEIRTSSIVRCLCASSLSLLTGCPLEEMPCVLQSWLVVKGRDWPLLTAAIVSQATHAYW